MRFVGLVFVFLIAGCGTLADAIARIGAPMPLGFVRFTPDTAYLAWWREVEACSGKRGSMREVEWFYYPGEPLIPGEDVPAITRRPGHDTFFADSMGGFPPWRVEPFMVRHEMLHHMPDIGSGHPLEYFGSRADSTFGRCGHIVARP